MRISVVILSPLILAFFCLPVPAQLIPVWETNYSRTAHFRLSRIAESGNGGYVAAGDDMLDIYVFKIDKNGGQVWERRFRGVGRAQVDDIAYAGDGGFVVLGFTETLQLTGGGTYLFKIDCDGNMIWEKILHPYSFGRPSEVTASRDGGCVLVTSLLETAGDDLFKIGIAQIDAEGNLTLKVGSELLHSGFHNLVEAGDGGFVGAGGSKALEKGSSLYLPYLFRIDRDGVFVWEKILWGLDITGSTGAAGIAPSRDGGYVVAALTRPDATRNASRYRQLFSFEPFSNRWVLEKAWTFGPGGRGIYIFKIDGNGTVLWDKVYERNGTEYVAGIIPTRDGGFVTVGLTPSGQEVNEAYLLKIDSQGDEVWEKGWSSAVYSVMEDPCGSGECYAVVGTRYPVGDKRLGYVARLYVPVPPAPPRLNPTRANVSVGQGFVVSWEEVPGAEKYLVQEDTDPDFSSNRTIYEGTGTQINVTKDAEGTYYYRVKAEKRGLWSEWSTYRSIEILIPRQPPAPPVIKPLLTGVEIGENYEISWSEVPESEGYIVQEDTDPSFPGNRTIYTGMDTHVTLTKDSPGTYYYRVRAAKDSLWSEWSQYESILIQPIPVPPKRNRTGLLLVAAAVTCVLIAIILAMARKGIGSRTKERRAS